MLLTIGLFLGAAGCGTSGADAYADKLQQAGFDSVEVDRDVERSGTAKKKRKKLVAYDFDWEVSTDNDPATCTVELEHPALSSGGLQGDHWHIDEVNGEDVSGWGTQSPDADTVRRLLREHGYDC
ncbi:MAG: hypothetical protein HKP61_19365 [Dactylosporangium sp.]|nr:hypothetical protein [Dactylosporangium sp.]NNJ63049.1 hypothetical protein [Dactylosporangium sp.]